MKVGLVAVAWCTVTLAAAGEAVAKSTESAGPPAALVRVLGRVNVNEASLSELLRIPGMTPADSDAIVSGRRSARLRSLEELGRLLGPQRLDALRRYLKVEGPTDLRRIRQLPLIQVDQRPTSPAPDHARS